MPRKSHEESTLEKRNDKLKAILKKFAIQVGSVEYRSMSTEELKELLNKNGHSLLIEPTGGLNLSVVFTPKEGPISNVDISVDTTDGDINVDYY